MTSCRFPFALPVNPAGLTEGSRRSAGAEGGRPPQRRTDWNALRRSARRYPVRWAASFLADSENDVLAIPPGCSRIPAREPVVVPPLCPPERHAGYSLPTQPGWARAQMARTPDLHAERNLYRPCQSARGQAHSMTLPRLPTLPTTRSVLDCGSSLPLLDGGPAHAMRRHPA